ncbi:hypothetical protein NXF25_019354 [Crotalus adamanteus]|uniref:Uncharacterized protein n=1 Tax=Crotalus adamanteus TaxID=8729 RepID=A0AAW1B1W6_CROAD
MPHPEDQEGDRSTLRQEAGGKDVRGQAGHRPPPQ